jgi:CheY-like chemotaxis protein
MSIKVLVFESDAAFAGELRNELGKLGCSTCVVDDGTVGLQQASAERPDLILLSIELPRMNGFSVCNKLKKDASLKNVPLIIMSSESSDETFEQHRKLRTRAEDYVHKPIAFGELLQHIRTFVPMEDTVVPDTGDADGIVIDDEISVQQQIEVLDTDGAIGGPPGHVPVPAHTAPQRVSGVDADIDAFTETAFDMLQDAPRAAPVAAKDANGTRESASTRPPPARALAVETQAANRSLGSVPRETRGFEPLAHAPAADNEELVRLRSELEQARAHVEELERSAGRTEELSAEVGKSAARAEELELRVGELEKEVADANQRITRFHEEADAEAERKQREVDELKALVAKPAGKSGGVSTREFLDLREALNKKDKEILALKEAVSSREREVFEGRDKTLAVERNLAEADEKILARERELAELREKTDEVTAQLEAFTTKHAGLQDRFDKTTAELESTAKLLAGAEEKVASIGEDIAQAKAAATEVESRHKAAVEDIESRHQVELDEREAKVQAVAEEATNDREAALAKARSEADAQRTQAVAAREKELRAEADAKLAALHRAHQDELSRTKNEFAKELESAKREAAKELEGAKHEADERLAVRERELASKETEALEAAGAKADARVGEVEERAASELREVRERLEGQVAGAQAMAAAAEESVAQLRRELEAEVKAKKDVADEKGASDAANEARINDLTERLSRAETARDSFEKEGVEARARIEAIEAQLAAEGGRLKKALSKWDADRGTLERAKDALAVALSQIDEVEGRAIDD